ncbi:MAG: hypothetical protein JWR50_3793 [Mucilaginibacter sp.]|nr:hypothetical protein [Mucilaginibacter sp.]
MPEKNTQRLIYIDQLKGIAIFLVVAGHFIQYNTIDPVHNSLFAIIYSFHMPLFMFLSGYIAYKTITENIFNSYLKFIKKKGITILLPFFSWPLIISPFFLKKAFNYDPIKTLITIVKAPTGGLWFLWFLFFITIIYSGFIALTSLTKRKNIYIDTFFFLFILTGVYSIKYLNIINYIDSFTLYVFFFFIGVFVSKYENFRAILFNNYVFSFCLIFFAVLCSLYEFNSHNRLNFILKLFLANSAIFALYFIVCKINWNNRINNYICYWGQNSLIIYVMQFSFINLLTPKYYLPQLNPIILILITVVFSIIVIMVCLGIAKIVELSKILNLVMFGRTPSPKS